MFVDKAKIHVKSGSGGNGVVAWRREKYVPYGGPAGGNGGNGGDIYIEATEDLSTLMDFKYQSIFKADDGERGGIKNMHGRQGQSTTIRVPCGTIIRDAETGQAIADLTKPGDRVVVAAGGRGGRGNSSFTSSVRQAPQFSEPGEPGVERDLELELKLIADVGLIGLPNAGKSTLISVISAAKPKIADYPFTTLTPNLGVVRKPSGDGIVVADIPGLIEGASEGVGLGHEFLRHVERTRLLLHLVDLSGKDDPEREPLTAYEMIQNELERYSPRLAKKPQMIVLTKRDAVDDDVAKDYRKRFEEKDAGPVYVISAATHQNLEPMLHRVFNMLEDMPREEEVVPIVEDTKAFDHDDSAFEIHHRKGKVFEVTGGKVERLFAVTDMRNNEAVQRLMNILRSMGVFSALAKRGAVEGDTVRIFGNDFEYSPDPEDARI